MEHQIKCPRTLALYVTRRGVAFVLFTSPLVPHDWGTKEVRGTNKHADSMRAAKQLIDSFRPDALVIEDTYERGSRRVPRVRRLHRALARYGERQGIAMEAYSRNEVKETFSQVGTSTKHEIASVIAGVIPALAAWLPRKRKPWESESATQGIFDAASLGLTFFVRTGRLDIEAIAKEETASMLDA